MANAATLLRVWMAEHQVSAKTLAGQAGITASYLSHLRAGRQLPSRRLATTLERLTDGAVPATAWDEQGAPSAALDASSTAPAPEAA